MKMFNPLSEHGFIYDILVALGLVVDFEITDSYTFLYSIFIILIAVIFIVILLRVLFRCLSSLFKGAGL